MKTSLLLPIALLPFTGMQAQREVPMPPYTAPVAADAVIHGDRVARTITCHERIRVYVQGAGNEVQLYGDCGMVRVQGNRNFLWVDRDSQIAVEGDNNVTYIRTSTTRVSVHGSGNRFELRR